MNEIVDRGAINRAITIPSVQPNQHVGLRCVVTDFPNKAALRRFGACKRIEANWCIAIFDSGDAFGKGWPPAQENDYANHHTDE
jgi:hypothetical protein